MRVYEQAQEWDCSGDTSEGRGSPEKQGSPEGRGSPEGQGTPEGRRWPGRKGTHLAEAKGGTDHRILHCFQNSVLRDITDVGSGTVGAGQEGGKGSKVY